MNFGNQTPYRESDFNRGYREGHEDGYDEGESDGLQTGYTDGWREGGAKARAKAGAEIAELRQRAGLAEQRCMRMMREYQAGCVPRPSLRPYLVSRVA